MAWNPYLSNYAAGAVQAQGVSLPQNQFGSLANAQIQELPSVSKNPWLSNELAGNIAGGIGAGANAVSVGLDFAGTMKDAIGQYKDMKFQSADTMVGGVPSYSGVAELGQQYGAIDPNDAGKGLGLQGAMSGAKAGGAIGSAFTPIGGLIGAGVGAIAGLTAGLFGKNKAKKEADLAKERGKNKFIAGQNQYNEDVGDYYDIVDASRQQSQSERNYAKRLYGINQYRDPFSSIV